MQAAAFVTANGGSVVLNEDGSFDYTPAANFTGADSFDYTVGDGNTGQDTGTVTIDVTPLNDPPVAQDDQFTTAEDTSVSGDVLADNSNGADSDPDGDDLKVSAVNGNAASVGMPLTLASGALLTLAVDGTFAYDPNGQFDSLGEDEQATDSFTYEVSDGNDGVSTATAEITIDGVSSTLPSIELTKTAEVTLVSSGSHSHHWWPWKGGGKEKSFDVTYTYEIRNASEGTSDAELTLTSLMEDHGTPGDANDDIDLLASLDNYLGGDDDGDGKLDVGEVWQFQATEKIDFGEGGSLLTTATATAEDSDANIASSSAELTIEKPLNVITGTNHKDWLWGTRDDDAMTGLRGNDKLFGRDGNDEMFGNEGRDYLVGGKGDDVIDPGEGRDISIGGWGSDIFVLNMDGAFDWVMDFKDGVDQIGLPEGIAYDDLSIEDKRGGVKISYEGEAEMFLSGMDAAQIMADDFHMNA